MSTLIRCTVALGLFTATMARAIELGDGQLNLNGFGGVGVGFTDGNDYVFGNSVGSKQMADLGISLTARPVEQLSVVGQFMFHEGGSSAAQHANLDWAFADWRFADLLHLRAGLAKMPLGLFNEIRDIGTLRPMLVLPQGIYGPSEVAAPAYQGFGITGRWEPMSDWAVEYDVFAGALGLKIETPWQAIDSTRTFRSGESPTQAVGMRLALLTPLEGFRLVASGYLGRMLAQPGIDDVNRQVTVIGFSGEYVDHGLALRVEAFFRRVLDDQSGGALYVEPAYFLTQKLQVVGRFELSTWRLNWREDQPSPLLLHRELAGGLAYWFSPGFVVKLSYHNVFGNRFAYPSDVIDAYNQGRLRDRTQVVMLGTHFSF